MAGIVGIQGKDADPEKVARMLEALRHRGPDTTRTFEAGSFAAAVCASDLSRERGDGFASDGDVAVVLDGDVYNERTEGLSDAEVVLDFYKSYGRAFAGHIEGVFACAIYDSGELILARDSVGVRPLYRGRTAGGDWIFASEVKSLVGLAEQVWELLPAITWSSEAGLSAFLAHYPEISMPRRFDEAAAKVRDVLTRAVERRMEDGAVGACLLSGGLDSTIITCAAHEIDPDLPAVTVGMEGAPDLENARHVAEELGIKHEVRIYDEDDVAELVPAAVHTLESFDEDCVSGAIANLTASSVASSFTNCILSGEGGDELFGGYHLLKYLDTNVERLRMMERLIEIAYNTALQRLDRAMFANSINYRTPFIDTEVVALAPQLPVPWKIHRAQDGRFVEKYVLREAFKDLIPERIYEREKLRFAAGTGTDDTMDRIAEAQLGDGEFNEETRRTPEGYELNSPKELWYYRLFRKEFPGGQYESLVGRWDPHK